MKCNQCDYQSNDITLFVLHNQVHELAALRAERDELRETVRLIEEITVKFGGNYADEDNYCYQVGAITRAILAKYPRKDTHS